MSRETLTVRCPDGRQLLAEVAGPEDGDLVVFHTGTPGSCYLYDGQIRECAQRGLRVACAARPGYDGSDRLPGRSYADNPADTAVVADELGAKTFYVIGHSGGGGPALADAALLPQRVRAAAAVSTLAPREAAGFDWHAGLEANQPEEEALLAGDAELEALLSGLAEAMGRVKTGEDIIRNDDLRKFYADVDRACFSGEFLEFMVRSYPLAVRGGIWGWFDDDKVIWGDWGFDLTQIDVPVAVWQGGRDRTIPVAHTEWIAGTVPGAEYRLLEDEGHVSLLKHRYGEILDQLLAA